MSERLIFWPLVGLTLLSPLPFGAVQAWSWGLLGILTGLAAIAWCAAAALNPELISVPLRRIWMSAALFGLAIVWAQLQGASWMPEPWHHPIWEEAAKALDAPLDGAIAVERYEIGSVTLRLLAYAAIFWIVLQFARTRQTARRLLYALLAAEAVYAVYGLIIAFSGSETILWYAKQYYLGNLTSTFVNRNSYATYAGIGLLAATAVAAHRLLSLEPGVSRRDTLRIVLRALAEREWPYLLIWVAMFTALLLTGSRAGVASACVGLAAFLLLIGRSPSVPRAAARIMTGTFVAVVLVMFVVSGGTIDRRLYTSIDEDGPAAIRPELYELSLNAIGDSPLLGFGLGSFESVFHLYRTDSHELLMRSVRAHNTYLENALDLGIPAAAALCLAVILVALRCGIGALRRRRDFVYPALAFAVSVQVGLHSLVDFSLQIPAIAATYALVLGLGLAQSWSTDSPSTRAYE